MGGFLLYFGAIKLFSAYGVLSLKMAPLRGDVKRNIFIQLDLEGDFR